MSVLTDGRYRAYEYLGCHPTETGFVFRLWAPNAKYVAVVGDFNGWDDGANPMGRDRDGFWCAEVEGIEIGQVYKYSVEGPDGRKVLKADPFAFHAETGPATGSKVWDISQFPWDDREWMENHKLADHRSSPINIYEVHLGAWRRNEDEVFPNYQRIAPILAAYCQMMGYTHVELLPVTEYPFEGSWGYQVTGYFAPTSRYGTPQDFMAFVDTLHRAGIGVIIDWVAAHFPKDEHGLARFDGTALYEYADPRMGEHAEWGTLVFDYASADVRGFLISSALFFLEQYHIDGLRCDAVTSMLYRNYARKDGEWVPNKDGGDMNYEAIGFWQELNIAIHDRFPGAFTVAEESTAYQGITSPPDTYGGLGFTFKWDMGFMHDTIDYFKLDPVYRQYHHDKLTFSMMYAFNEYYINAFSHDEVVHGKCSMLNKMAGLYDDKFANLRALYGYQFAHPGKKLTFMGSEFAQVIEFDEKRQLDWFLLEYPRHIEMQRFTAALGQLYLSQGALWQIEDNWEGFSWLNADAADVSCVAFIRLPKDRKKYKPVVCVCNFTPMYQEDFVMGLPSAGKLAPLLNSDEHRFGGFGCLLPEITYDQEQFKEFDHRAHLALPPLSSQYFQFEEEITPCRPKAQKKTPQAKKAQSASAKKQPAQTAPSKKSSKASSSSSPRSRKKKDSTTP